MQCDTTTCAFNLPCVPSVGPIPCNIAVLAENPGYKEIEIGKPLVGPAGKRFDEILAAAGLDRSVIFIMNTVGCTDLTRENRHPMPAEIEACRPRLLADIERSNPKVIVSLGGYAHSLLFPGFENRVGRVRHMIRNWNGRMVVGSYHPAATLPFRNPDLFQLVVEDFMLAKELCAT